MFDVIFIYMNIEHIVIFTTCVLLSWYCIRTYLNGSRNQRPNHRQSGTIPTLAFTIPKKEFGNMPVCPF